jgi:site-specific DNA recombinase
MVNQKPKNYKIALYIRVSTEEQAENPEGSIRNQEDRLRQAVEYKNRMGDFGKLAGVYIDAGISAKDMRRPQLQELLRAIRAKEIDLVMVTELSRLSRNSRDFIEMWDMMRACGCSFTSLREDFDTTTAAGEMVIFQLMNLAQFERRQVSERVEANIAARAARGLYNGGVLPVGFKTIEDKPGYLAIDEEDAATVRAAFTAFLKEGSLAPAARWLNDHGYQMRKETFGGGRIKRQNHFTVDNLQSMLRNKAYIGIKSYTFRGEKREAKAVWPAIIDEVTFQRVGKILEKNRGRYRPHKAGRLPYLLTGICACMKCASPMPGKSATGNGGKVGYYEHVWATKRDSTLTKKLFKCDPHRVPVKKLDPFVLDKFKRLIMDRNMIATVLETVKAKHEENPQRKDQERMKAKIFGINSQIEALAERLAEIPKSVSAQPIYKQMEKLETVKKDYEDQLAKLKQSGRSSLDRVEDLNKFEDFASHYRRFLSNATVQEQKMMLKKFIKKVEVGLDSVKIHWIVDQEHYERELQLEKAGAQAALGGAGLSQSTGFFKNYGSCTLTNGAPGRT